MATVYTVAGQHRTAPGLLLLLGDDNRYYAHAGGRLSPIERTAAWVLDGNGEPGTDIAPVAVVPVSAPELPNSFERRPMSLHPMAAQAVSGWRMMRMLAIVLALILGMALAAPAALASAPALATASTDVALLAAPSVEAAVLAMLPAGAEVELTGAADGEFLEVSSDGQLGWATVRGLDGRLDTAAVVLDASLRAAPSEDGEILGAVQAGSTVILTGASVDGYLAASFAGTGGWLPASAVA